MKKSVIAIVLSFAIHGVVIGQENSGLTEVVVESKSAAVQLFDSGKNAEAKKLFLNQVKLNKKDASSYLYLSRIAARENKMDDAEDYIEKALKYGADNAQIQNLSGQIYGAIAQSASVFSQFGYAKDSLAGFTKAVELAPDNLNYRMGLLSFHLNAPSIVGGDKEIALEQALAISEMNKKEGYKALANVYFVTEETDKLSKHFATMPEEFQTDADVLLSKAIIFVRSKKYSVALDALKQTLAHVDKETQQSLYLTALYQYGKTSALANAHLEEGAAALMEYQRIADRPGDLPSDEWANFRLANVIAKQGKVDQAKTMYKEIKSATNDKQLLKELNSVL